MLQWFIHFFRFMIHGPWFMIHDWFPVDILILAERHTCQEPVMVPPIRLQRLTASTIKKALDAWHPFTATSKSLNILILIWIHRLPFTNFHWWKALWHHCGTDEGRSWCNVMELYCDCNCNWLWLWLLTDWLSDWVTVCCQVRSVNSEWMNDEWPESECCLSFWIIGIIGTKTKRLSPSIAV